MRHFSSLVFAAVILAAADAAAQQSPSPCPPVTPVRVTVATTAGTTIRGTLLCLTGTEVVLTGSGTVTSTALSDVRRIETRSDPVWDGALKGAAIPLVIWLIFCRDCEAAPMLRTTAAYATIGGVWDALDTNRTRIYDGRPAAAIRWRLRF